MWTTGVHVADPERYFLSDIFFNLFRDAYSYIAGTCSTRSIYRIITGNPGARYHGRDCFAVQQHLHKQ